MKAIEGAYSYLFSLYFSAFCSFNRNVSSGAYHIKIVDQKTSLIYCKMESTPECGEGGWTLALKMDGSKV